MCRHLAYLGEAATLRSVLMDPPHSLQVQAWAPRRQRHGTLNADGFGVGWYADGDPVPARYRRARPIWSDPSFADLARVTRSRAVLAAVRSATPGTEAGEAAAAPYAAGRWLFSHNGALSGWNQPPGSRPGGRPATCSPWKPAVTRPSSGRSCCAGCGPAAGWPRRWPGPSVNWLTASSAGGSISC